MKEITKVKIEKGCLKVFGDGTIGAISGTLGYLEGTLFNNIPIRIGIYVANVALGYAAALGYERVIDKEFETIELEAVRLDSIRGLND